MKTRVITIVFSMVFLITKPLSAQQIIRLYNQEIPNSKTSDIQESGDGVFANVTHPTLEYFKPEIENQQGTAVIIIPGGGYGVVVYDGEGVSTAKALAKKGIASFVLKYRLPSDATMQGKKIGPIQDAQQAIKTVRENAEKWGIDKNKVGVMGFSAGGHLATTAATHYQNSYIENTEGINLRPDFQILVYPVISMTDSLTHYGSRDNLLGKNPSKEDIQLFSNETQINKNTPPALNNPNPAEIGSSPK